MDQRLKLLFDIGGTTIREALYTSDRLSHIQKYSSRDKPLDQLLFELISAKNGISSISVSFAGQVVDGAIVSSPNIALGALKNKKFDEWTQENFKLPSKIDNDLLCVALAEMSANKSKNMAIFYIGTGFGAAFIVDGNLLKGASNLAGEIGHIPYKKAPFVCGCGNDNCLELYCSGKALESWCDHLDLPKIALEKMADQTLYSQIFTQFFDAFDHAINTTTAMLNPETIILGGGVAKSSELLLTKAKEALKNGFAPARDITIRQSTLDDTANLIGAARL